jgi:hypothetical protein
VPVALAATDGVFDEPFEELAGALDTSALAEGVHTVWVEARDAAGNWGPLSAARLAIVDPADDPVIAGTVTGAGSGSGLAARVTVGPFAAATDPSTGAWSLRVPAGTWDVVARADLHAPRTAAAVVAAPGATIVRDFALPEPVFADDAEGANPGWTAQSPWAVRTDVAHRGSRSWSDSAANYADGSNVALTSPVVDLTEATGVELVFHHLHQLEGSFDFAHVEVSTNGGTTWTPVERFSGAVAWDWRPVAIPLPALAGAAAARFRFRLTSDVGVVRDGWHLDDVALTAIVEIPDTMPFLDGFESGDTAAWSVTLP